MPPRASHIPNNNERVALQRLRGGRELPASLLHPAGKLTIRKMTEKGWIMQKGCAYCITTAGETALAAHIPDTRSERRKR